MGTTIKWIVLAACLWKPLLSQDLRLWVGASAKQSVHRKVDLGLEIQHRWQGGLDKVDAFFLEPSFGYEPVRNLHLGFAWRVANTLDEETDAWHLRHRPQIDLELKHRWKRWRPFVRFRYQARYSTLGGVNKPWLMHARTKAGLKYSWLGGKGSNTLFGECWWPLNRSGRQQPDRYRLGLSTSIQLGKRHEVSVQLAYEERFRSGPNPQSFIVGVFYSFRSAEAD
jgi:hypothetical protein